MYDCTWVQYLQSRPFFVSHLDRTLSSRVETKALPRSLPRWCRDKQLQKLINVRSLFSSEESWVTLRVVHSLSLYWAIQIIGWIYFCAWSVSFYPQIFLNFSRKRFVCEIYFIAYGTRATFRAESVHSWHLAPSATPEKNTSSTIHSERLRGQRNESFSIFVAASRGSTSTSSP